MKKQVYNVKDKPWEETGIPHVGKSKTLVDHDLFTGGSIKIVKIEAGSNFNTHEHEYLQILYFTIGEGILTIDDELYPIEPGVTAIIFPNQCHSVENTSETGMEVLVIESYNLPENNTPYVDF